ncbi:glycoside/pentoside/hexuronide:cation symporter, GPH family/probable glucitol transport protein GutA [Actinomyces ruminicola]|uniref:Glycoside/pentoside/hexuronide:cation symporter, GPH family/probable glucitol transport protein GutA n=1 Tax=Actinomyces ruminicola TaxID=332524 RepID=A0A1H0B7E0_9ACTO|nr:glycoside-pentoside-hexuronide (GPH):cation symporter [Actinomyces ruminicola]SDN41605.1 glycoside/pentoside/hexuronide:cation symporter, GPH family/probable glucitol transport protein GutA [Actinomyces ruminicola]
MTTQSEAPRTPGAQVPLKEKVSYAFAEFGSQFIWTTVGSYLMTFYTDVALIPAAVAGNILLLARVLDGIQDLGFGYIAERTKSRWGRFRPYVIFGAPLLSISMVLAFWMPFHGGSMTKAVWAAITYVLLCFLYTVANMSYGSLAGVMTTDSGERVILNWIRNIGSQAAQLIMNVATPFLLLALVASAAAKDRGFDARSFFLTMLIYSLVALPAFLITGINVRERITMTPEQQKVPFGRTVKAVLGNGQLMVVFFTLLLQLFGLFGRIGVMFYYCRWILGSPLLMAGVMSAFQIGMIIGGLLLPPFALKLGKRNMMMASVLSGGIVLMLIFFFGQTNLTVLLVLQFLYGFSGFASPIALSMVPDAVDYYEHKTGIRADGTSYATVSLSTKFANAIGGAFALYIMGWFGYNGALDVQSSSALTGINIAANLVPAIMSFLALVPLLFWKLDTKTMARISAELEVKRAAQAEALAEGKSLDEAEALAEHALEEGDSSGRA